MRLQLSESACASYVRVSRGEDDLAIQKREPQGRQTGPRFPGLLVGCFCMGIASIDIYGALTGWWADKPFAGFPVEDAHIAYLLRGIGFCVAGLLFLWRRCRDRFALLAMMLSPLLLTVCGRAVVGWIAGENLRCAFADAHLVVSHTDDMIIVLCGYYAAGWLLVLITRVVNRPRAGG